MTFLKEQEAICVDNKNASYVTIDQVYPIIKVFTRYHWQYGAIEFLGIRDNEGWYREYPAFLFKTGKAVHSAKFDNRVEDLFG